MAITIGNNATARSSSGPASSFILNVPSGLSTASDGYEIVFANWSDNNGNNTITLTGGGIGSYTTHLSANANANGSIHGNIFLASRLPAASPASATSTSSGPYPSQHYIGYRLALTGVDQTTPFDVAIGGSPNQGTWAPLTAVPTMTASGITTTTANALVFAWFGVPMAIGDPDTMSTPSGWTKLYALESNTYNLAPSLAIYYKVQASPGATGDCVCDTGAGSPNDDRNWIAGQFALKPSSGGGGDDGPIYVPRIRLIGF